MGQVRAKFRCMSVTKTWDCTTEVRLMPVTQSQHNKENSQFWKYTPSGECKLCFRGPALDASGKKFEPGDYYYIDMKPDEDGGWFLSTVTFRDEENGDIALTTRGGKHMADFGEGGFTYGKLDMGIDNPPAFLAFGTAGKPWAVEFNWAEGTDDTFAWATDD